MKILRSQRTVLPSSHQVGGKLLGWLGVILSKGSVSRIFFHEPVHLVNMNDHPTKDRHLLVKLRD
jgi:hypothetical protein